MMTLIIFIRDSIGWEGAALKYMNAEKKKKAEEKLKAERQVKKGTLKK